MTRAPRLERQGLTLIEVLLALTILLLAFVVIGRLVDMGTDREMDGRLQTQGTRLAQGKLAEFESGGAPLESGEGSFEGDDAGWSWRATAEQQSTPPNLWKVEVEATRTIKGRDVTITLSQMIFDPAMMGSAAEAVRPDGTSSSGGMP